MLSCADTAYMDPSYIAEFAVTNLAVTVHSTMFNMRGTASLCRPNLMPYGDALPGYSDVENSLKCFGSNVPAVIASEYGLCCLHGLAQRLRVGKRA